MKKLLLILLILFTSLNLKAQVTYGTINPSGACPGVNQNVLYINTTTNTFWWCASNQWNTGAFTSNQSLFAPNTFFAGPTSGGAAVPTARGIVAADLPLPTASTVGGIESYVAVSHQFIDSISVAGVVHSSQPSASDLNNGILGSGAIVLQQSVISNQTVNYSVLSGDSKKTFTNAGAGAGVTFQLPTCAAGLQYTFIIQAAQTLTVKAGVSDKIRNAATLGAANGTAVDSTIGDSSTMECIGTSPSEWDFISIIGSGWNVT